MGRATPLPLAHGPALLAVVVLSAAAPAWGQQVPRRQIPAPVLAELTELESRFELALATDCHHALCFSKGCAYGDHAVIDRPRATSLPGLGGVPGPGSVEPQEFLTRATCAFAHESTVTPEEAQVLVRRLQSKVSGGFLTVGVSHQRLEEIPARLRTGEDAEPPPDAPPDEPVEPVEPVAESWSLSVAARELWTTLLPHTAWMIALVMLTIAATVLTWAFRRVGRDSIEDQMLLASIARGDDGGPPPPAEDDDDDDAAFVAEQRARWSERMSSLDAEAPDPELQALVRELLRSGDRALLAKTALTYPQLTRAFPDGGELAEAKLDLAAYLKTVEPDELPSDAAFYRSLNQHALSATVADQTDARIVRSLREDFGAAGLATLIGRLPARQGALLYALAPSDEQHEILRLLLPAQLRSLAANLLRSNRMHPTESQHLFDLLTALRNDQPLPEAPPTPEVADRGSPFDAAGALSVLLAGLDAPVRRSLFAESLERFGGSIPSWYRGILLADMLFELPREAMADLVLGVDVEPLAAWLSLLDAPTQQRLQASLPRAAAVSVQSAMVFPSRQRQLALASKGRRRLATAFQQQLARAGRTLEQVLVPASAPAFAPDPEEDTQS